MKNLGSSPISFTDDQYMLAGLYDKNGEFMDNCKGFLLSTLEPGELWYLQFNNCGSVEGEPIKEPTKEDIANNLGRIEIVIKNSDGSDNTTFRFSY